MDPANGEKSRDVEQELLNTAIPSKPSNAREKTDKMYMRRLSLLHFLALCLFFVGVYSTFQAAVSFVPSARTPRNPTVRDQQRFQELLNSIDPPALHEHVEKYNVGGHQDEKTAGAVEIVSSLVEIVRRQAGSTNGTSSIPTSSSTSLPTDSSSTSVGSTSSTDTTESSGSSSTSVTQESTSSTTPPPTSSETSSTTTSSSSEGSTSSSEESQSTPTSSQVTSSSESSETSSPSVTSQTSVTSFDIFTSTAADGKPTTVTRTTVVPAAGQADQSPGGGSATKTGANPSLQSDGASMRKISVGMFIGTIAVLIFGAL